jgi:hypothetical protein
MASAETAASRPPSSVPVCPALSQRAVAFSHGGDGGGCLSTPEFNQPTKALLNFQPREEHSHVKLAFDSWIGSG